MLQEGRFKEAADCHELVSSLLGEAHSRLESSYLHFKTSSLSSQTPPTVIDSFHSLVTLESLKLQQDYHKRQAAVVRMKQAQYDEYKTALENQQREILNRQVTNELDTETNKFDGSLRQAIYRTIEEQDSLLTLISLPDDGGQAFKYPKDTSTVIEELKTVNYQLRTLVGNLLSQLEAKDAEIRQLKEQLHAVSVNPNDDTRLDNAHSLRLAPLPPLAPLEMPLFDFSST